MEKSPEALGEAWHDIESLNIIIIGKVLQCLEFCEFCVTAIILAGQYHQSILEALRRVIVMGKAPCLIDT